MRLSVANREKIPLNPLRRLKGRSFSMRGRYKSEQNAIAHNLVYSFHAYTHGGDTLKAVFVYRNRYEDDRALVGTRRPEP